MADRHDAPTWTATARQHAGPATTIGVHDLEVLGAHLWALGAIAVEVDDDTVVGRFSQRVATDEVTFGDPPSRFDLAWEPQPAEDHMAAWRARSVPVRAGRFDLVPSHRVDDHASPRGTHRIVIDAGMAFGSGHHETTAGCLEALGDRDIAGLRIADIGTGTGILAIGAMKAGADEVVAVDTDPVAIEVARRNCRANDVEVALAVGSTEAVSGRCDGVLANLLTGVLVELADDLAGLLRPGGWLIASGVGIGRSREVVGALARVGFTRIDLDAHGEWVVVTAIHPTGHATTPPLPAPTGAPQ